jgi:uncharacterized protein (DUF1697 family)
MGKYIALLRGVNVGGKNKVPMPLLKMAFERAGFSQVRTYINSGNILFSCDVNDIAELQQGCKQVIQDQFQYDIPVAVISAEDFSDALRYAPLWWDEDRASKHIAIFVISPANADAIIEEVGIKPEYEKLAHHGQVIFWSAPLKTFSRTKWSNVIATPAYSNITIRNANTAKTLLQLLG